MPEPESGSPEERNHKLGALALSHVEHVLSLAGAARRAYAERLQREVEYHRTCGLPDRDAQKVAVNELAFVRAEIDRELQENIVRLARELIERVNRVLAEYEEEQ